MPPSASSRPLRRSRWDWPLVLPLLALVHAYRRWLSPLLPPACRFEPSCSQYAVHALHQHGLLRALGLVAWRLLRCQPLCRGGHDPVPAGRYTTAPDPVAVPESGRPAVS